MSTATPSPSSSFSPASSLSSAWSASLPHAHPLASFALCTMSVDPALPPSASRAPAPAQHPAGPCRIAALPSLAHSLSAFPTMTVVRDDMVHYGNLCRTKGASEAKLNSALRLTNLKQRLGAASPTPPADIMICKSPIDSEPRFPQVAADDDLDDPVLLLIPKRSKVTKRSVALA